MTGLGRRVHGLGWGLFRGVCGMCSVSGGVLSAVLGCASGAVADDAVPAASAPERRFTPVGAPGMPGEDEVRDAKSRLVWRRCVEGMAWANGTCVGRPTLLDHQAAQALALAEFKTTGVRWRMPQVMELRMLLEPKPGSAANAVQLDAVAFPASPVQWHWTGSTTVRGGAGFNPYNYGNITQGRAVDDTNRLGFLHGWAVNLGTGEAAGDVSRRSGLAVRLVRPDF